MDIDVGRRFLNTVGRRSLRDRGSAKDPTATPTRASATQRSAIRAHRDAVDARACAIGLTLARADVDQEIAAAGIPSVVSSGMVAPLGNLPRKSASRGERRARAFGNQRRESFGRHARKGRRQDFTRSGIDIEHSCGGKCYDIRRHLRHVARRHARPGGKFGNAHGPQARGQGCAAGGVPIVCTSSARRTRQQHSRDRPRCARGDSAGRE